MFTDALIMDKTWDAPGGFLGFSARFARTGVQMYDGSEIDPDGVHKLADGTSRFKRGTLYPVDRPASEVFKPTSLASFIAKPLTNEHPAEGVTIDNWGDKTKGVIGEVLRDGEFARMSGLMTDKALIADYRAGKKELSGGYEANLVIRDGVNEAGEAYVAQQTDIVGNHTAFVQRGRAGSLCRVVDAAPCDSLPSNIIDSLKTEKPVMKTMLIDGLTVDVSNADTAMATIQTLVAARDAANGKISGLETQVATLTTDKATLESKVKELTDAKPTPAQLRDAAKAYAAVADKAKAHGVTVTDAMDEPAIIKATVLKHLGDAAGSAKEWTDAQFSSSFAMLKDGDASSNGVQSLGSPAVSTNIANIRDAARAASNR